MKNVVSHTGKVVSVSDTHVFVQIERGGACAGCKSRQACQMGKSENPVIAIQTLAANTYSIDEEVYVIMKTVLGLKAVLYAYVLPFVFLVAAFIVVRQFTSSEIVQVLLALLPVIVYYIILYTLRDRIESSFQFFIEKT